ncbi:MAG: hypothetical protein IPP35_10835 [Elusimicrobia bacterium]|nr:hypothetical protein [Elusimicrobiota bacterium]
MHIPDGFIDAKTIVLTSVLAVAGVEGPWFASNGTFPNENAPPGSFGGVPLRRPDA